MNSLNIEFGKGFVTVRKIVRGKPQTPKPYPMKTSKPRRLVEDVGKALFMLWGLEEEFDEEIKLGGTTND